MHEYNFEDTRLRLLKGDITDESVDIIVNAANSGLMGGGGVDGAIHRAGGPSILEECRQIVEEQGNLPTGQAVATQAGNLDAQWVIHTVGPFWRGSGGEDALLCNAYRNSLELADKKEARTIAFPSISTGAYRFPIGRAARLALVSIAEWILEGKCGLNEIRMVLYTLDDFRVYGDALDKVVKYLSD